jgi:diguanylate cyclase (GGDEF)-like protein
VSNSAQSGRVCRPIGDNCAVTDADDRAGATSALVVQAVDQFAEALTITTAEADSRERSVVYANPAFFRLTGYGARDLADSPEAVPPAGEAAVSRKDGSTVVLETEVVVLRDDQQRVTHYVSMHRDVTSRRRAERELSTLAFTDALTGLANHRRFHDALQVEAARAERYGRELAVALLDIDQFKQINDTHGHGVGDEVLRDVAQHLDRNRRPTDVLGRLGGDELAWLMPEADADRARHAAERVRADIASSTIGGIRRVTISIGVCDLLRSESPAEMLRLADGALYWAKMHGRNQLVVYQPEVVEALSDAERAERLERRQGILAIRSLARAVDAKDHFTHRHSERVAELCQPLAETLGWSRHDRDRLHDAALVHDVGKIGIPDSILRKPDRLTNREYDIVKSHASLGAQIVAGALPVEQVGWIAHHHERVDGRGYPGGLAGHEIPLGARIMAVADAWDVMTSERPYQRPRALEEAFEECRRLAGRQFCPEVVDALDRVLDGHDGDAFTPPPES